ncbi:MAG: hypothetical protein KME40_24240 [Komarekiella atlantica HA4396-MV6]|jgi:hypothetical protein|nr:hypothetical protein [Komarekiella atlantica HA4396-MV6]
MFSLIISLLIVLGVLSFIALIIGAASPSRNSSHKRRRSNFDNSFSNSSWYVGDTGGYDSSNNYDSGNSSSYDCGSSYDSGSSSSCD